MTAPERRRITVVQGSNEAAVWPQQIFLPNPKTGVRQAYFANGQMLQEVNCFRPEFSSWFVDDCVVSDGGLYMLTSVDPLLLALPVLDVARVQRAGNDGIFRSKDELFDSDSRIAGDAACALCEAASSTLPLICDVRSTNNEQYYRLSNDKVKVWLKCKVKQIVEGLGREGSQYSSMESSDLQRYALGLLGEYLSQDWMNKLHSCYDLPTAGTEQPSLGQPDARILAEISSQDYKKRPRVDPKVLARQKAQEAREEKRQQQLKRETAGMKKMSAFFSAAPKAKANV